MTDVTKAEVPRPSNSEKDDETAAVDDDLDFAAGDDEDEDLGMLEDDHDDDVTHDDKDGTHDDQDGRHGDESAEIDEDLAAGDDEDEEFQAPFLEPVSARNSEEDHQLPVIASVSSIGEELE